MCVLTSSKRPLARWASSSSRDAFSRKDCVYVLSMCVWVWVWGGGGVGVCVRVCVVVVGGV